MTHEEIKRHRVESVLKEILPEAFSSLNDERINSLAVNDVKCSKGRSNAKVYLDKSFLNFVGLWLADGCYDKNSVIISVQEEENRKIVREIAKRFNCPVKMHVSVI